MKSCVALEKQDTWKGPCAGAATLGPGSADQDLVDFFQLNLQPWIVVNPDASTPGW